jgi:hypothetical protein
MVYHSSTTQMLNDEVSLSVYLVNSHASKVHSSNVISSMIIQEFVNPKYSRKRPKKGKGFQSNGVPCATTLKYTCRFGNPRYERVIFLNAVYGAL